MKTRHTAEIELDNAMHRVYERYGNDLQAFFRDAIGATEPQPASGGQSPAPSGPTDAKIGEDPRPLDR